MLLSIENYQNVNRSSGSIRILRCLRCVSATLRDPFFIVFFKPNLTEPMVHVKTKVGFVFHLHPQFVFGLSCGFLSLGSDILKSVEEELIDSVIDRLVSGMAGADWYEAPSTGLQFKHIAFAVP